MEQADDRREDAVVDRLISYVLSKLVDCYFPESTSNNLLE